jgi:hypothetical protein
VAPVGRISGKAIGIAAKRQHANAAGGEVDLADTRGWRLERVRDYAREHCATRIRRGMKLCSVADLPGCGLAERAIQRLRLFIESTPSDIPLHRIVPSVVRGDPTDLDAKHRATVDEQGMGAAVVLPDVSVATDWQSGRLSFDDEPLQYVVDVVNRYSGKRIVIADSRIADLRISGTVLGDHIDGWVASLNTAFGIRATEDEETIALAR